MSKGKVLVTGRYGFTGRYVASALEAVGWQVWGTFSHQNDQSGTFDRVVDLTNADSVQRMVNDTMPDAVVHLAGISFVGHGGVEDFYRVNVVGTRNLLEALYNSRCAQQGVILASSANIYGNTSDNPITENTKPIPLNDYAVSKLAMEQMANLFTEKLPIAITRPFNYTGIGQDPKFLIPKIVKHFRNREPKIELGNIDIERDFSDVRDVAQIYALLLDAQNAWGQSINICSGHTISMDAIIHICSQITQHEIMIDINPAFVRANEIKTLCGNRTKLNSMICGFERRTFESTLRWMLLQ